MPSSAQIPAEAKPHEVPILEKLLLGWSQKQIQKHLHYTCSSTVSRVQTKYAHLFGEA